MTPDSPFWTARARLGHLWAPAGAWLGGKVGWAMSKVLGDQPIAVDDWGNRAPATSGARTTRPAPVQDEGDFDIDAWPVFTVNDRPTAMSLEYARVLVRMSEHTPEQITAIARDAPVGTPFREGLMAYAGRLARARVLVTLYGDRDPS